jgi:hypothetical protein
MEIRLRVDQVDPPTGRLGRVPAADVERPDERSFTGWLELLAALSELLAGSADRP